MALCVALSNPEFVLFRLALLITEIHSPAFASLVLGLKAGLLPPPSDKVCFFNFLIFCVMSALSECTPACQRTSNPTKGHCEPPFNCWMLNLGSLEEQPTFLTAESPNQPKVGFQSASIRRISGSGSALFPSFPPYIGLGHSFT